MADLAGDGTCVPSRLKSETCLSLIAEIKKNKLHTCMCVVNCTINNDLIVTDVENLN